MTTRHKRERRRPLEGDVDHDVGQAAAGVQARHERITRGFDITRVADILKAANEKVGVPAEGTLVEQAERLIAATRDAVDAE